MSCTAYRRPTSDFYPRPPRGGRRCLRSVSSCSTAFLSTPSARRATSVSSNPFAVASISIHALREEGDTALCELDAALNKISIHALREEGDQHLLSCTLQHVIFLSTPSARRATSVLDTSVTATVFLSTPSARRATSLLSTALGTPTDFYPRPPRGGRPDHPGLFSRGVDISIHALREEGDRHCPRPRLVEVISIHALREEGDFWWADVPRICIEFLSTPSARRATHRRPAPGSRGSDFYPRPPRGGRPPARSDPRSGSRISIHALREEGDRCGGGKGKSPADFYPRPPRGGRRGSK